MRRAILFGIFILVLAVSTASFATPSELTGVETAVFSDREVVVIRHTGDASISPRYLYDLDKGTITLTLNNVSIKKPKLIHAGQNLLDTVQLEQVKGMNQARLTLAVKDRGTIDRSLFRCGSYTEHVLLIELFPSGENPKDEPPVRDLEGMLKQSPEERAQTALPKMLTPGQLITVDAQPKQALGLMEKKNLVQLDTKLTIISEDNGIVSSDHGQQGIKAALDEGAVSEVVFVGSKDKVQEARSFLRTTRLSQTARAMNAAAENSVPSATRTEGTDSDYPPLTRETPPDPFDLRNRLKDQLSDILVNLPATGGYNFYGVLMLLSQMSGISIIIDPYLVDPPTGSRRSNLLEPPGNSDQQGGQGFRGAEEFRSVNLRGATNTVIGNFENVPFETALKIILEAHNLDYLVFSTPESEFSKPVILVSSRERIQEEIFGANEIDLYQAHYADPQALYNALDNMDLLPSRERGWYVYENPGGGNSGGGGNNNQGGGNGGSGGSGGGNGGGGGGNGGGSGGPTGPGGGRSIMGYDVNPLEKQALMLEFSPATRDERISELLALAANKGLDLLTVDFSGAENAAKGRILVIVLGE